MLFIATVSAPLDNIEETYLVSACDRFDAELQCRAGLNAWAQRHGADYARFRLLGPGNRPRLIASAHAWFGAPEGARWF